MSRLTDICYAIAKKYHAGQFDKGGNLYINHPVAVAKKLTTEKEQCIALLHDIIEDTELTASDLLNLGVPKDIVDVVVILTHKKDEPYSKYITRISENELARKVKLADLEHNMDISRIKNPTQKDLDRIEHKYIPCYNYLKSFEKSIDNFIIL
jgi:(p)ppGpp synthase/HD superfamily hydrolase